MATEQDLASKKRAITLFAREKMAEHGLQGWRLGRPMPYYRLHPKYVAEYNRVMARRAEPQRHATEAELWAALEAGERAASAPRRTPSGATAQSIPVILAGDRVQLTRVRGHQSVKATVVKVGRTRYHVRFDGGAATYTVPMGAVDKI
jgi:hypothetical protein